MNKTKLTALLLLLALAGCTKKEYSRSEGIDKEIQLFGDQITVPVGSAGPITVKSTLMNLPLFAGMLYEAEDGTLYTQAESRMYAANVWEITNKQGDVSAAFTWDCGTHDGSPSGLAMTLGFMGFTCPNQTVDFYAKNPINTDVPLHGKTSVYRIDYTTYQSWTDEKTVEGMSLVGESGNKAIHLGHFDIPGTGSISGISIKELKMDLPANPAKKLWNDAHQSFEFTCIHRSNLAVGPNFKLEQNFPLTSLSVPIGQFKLHKCTAKLELENSLPLDVTVNSIKALKPVTEEGADPEENEDISITGEIHIPAGSPANPGVASIELQVEALNGTLPDLTGIKIEVSVKGDEAQANTVLTSKQGLYLKSSSVNLVGGITLNSHE